MIMMMMMTPPVEMEVRMRKKKISECDATPFWRLMPKGEKLIRNKSQRQIQKEESKEALDSGGDAKKDLEGLFFLFLFHFRFCPIYLSFFNVFIFSMDLEF